MALRVILHNAVSADGRIDWISPDLGLFYGLVSTWQEDATLVGCDTLLKAQDEIPEETDEAFKPSDQQPGDTRPILIVPDSRGRLKTWHYWKEQQYWRDWIALCSHTTPQDYFSYLTQRHIHYLIAGDDHVDLVQALRMISAQYNVKTIRVDSGGTLNGVLLRAGLVDEVSILICPSLVGGSTPRSLYRADDLTAADDVIGLKLIRSEECKDGSIWLRYEVIKTHN
ncbi:MAG: RibD family protein [candidate division WOR-3 bacterium]|nr:MAG: RibD family protein [candidate division WOR-3 bacterium]